MKTAEEYARALVAADQAGDVEGARVLAQAYQTARQQPAPDEGRGLFKPILGSVGQTIAGAGRLAEEFTGIGEGVQRFGEDIAAEYGQTAGLETPGRFATETVGSAVGSAGQALAGAGAGFLIGGPIGAVVGGLAPGALSAYQSIRGIQEQTGKENRGLAVAGALGSAALERALPGITRTVLGRVAPELAEQAAGGAVRQVARTAAGEAGVETLQQGIQRGAGGQEVFAEPGEYAESAIAGLIGGGAIGGISAAIPSRREQAAPAPESPDVVTDEELAAAASQLTRNADGSVSTPAGATFNSEDDFVRTYVATAPQDRAGLLGQQQQQAQPQVDPVTDFVTTIQNDQERRAYLNAFTSENRTAQAELVKVYDDVVRKRKRAEKQAQTKLGLADPELNAKIADLRQQEQNVLANIGQAYRLSLQPPSNLPVPIERPVRLGRPAVESGQVFAAEAPPQMQALESPQAVDARMAAQQAAQQTVASGAVVPPSTRGFAEQFQEQAPFAEQMAQETDQDLTQTGGLESPVDMSALQNIRFDREVAKEPVPFQLENVVSALTSRWENKPNIKIIEDFSQAPAAAQQANQEQLAGGASGNPAAFFNPEDNSVYLVRDQLRNPEQAAKAVFEESLGHYGLRGVFGNQNFVPILNAVYSAKQSEVRKLATQYGLNLDEARGRLVAAEEYLAKLAVEQPKSTFVQRAIAAIRKTLRQMGFKNLKLSDSEIIENFIVPARNFVQQQNAPTFRRSGDITNGSVPFQRNEAQINSPEFKAWFGDSKVVDANGKPLVVYHGTQHSFDRFARFEGYFFTNAPDQADVYAKGRGGNVMPVYVSLPDADVFEYASDVRPQDQWDYSRDIRPSPNGNIIRNTKTGEVMVIARRPEQIKSAIGNRGTFDPKDPDIRFMRAGGIDPETTPTAEATGLRNSIWKAYNKVFAPLYNGEADRYIEMGGIFAEFGQALRNLVDAEQRNHGIAYVAFEPADAIIENMSRGQRQAVLEEVEAIARDQQEGGRQNLLTGATPEARAYYEAQQRALQELGQRSERLGVKVKRRGKYQDFKMLDNYFPRFMKEEYARALRDPAGYPDQYAEIINKMIEAGIVKNAEEARRYATNYTIRASSPEFFGSLEAGRELQLPNDLYDFSPRAARVYGARWAKRMAEIEALGQGRGGEKDIFQRVLDSDDLRQLPNSPRQARRIEHIRDITYNKVNSDFQAQLLNPLSTLATGLQLGNPITSVRNLIGGAALSSYTFGPGNILKAYKEVLAEMDKLEKDGLREGVITSDLLRVMADVENANINDPARAAQKYANKITDFLMTQRFLPEGVRDIFTFEGSERLNRMVAAQAARYMLTDGIRAYNSNPLSKQAARFRRKAASEGLDFNKLVQEFNENTWDQENSETNKYIRRMVGMAQGTYRLDNTPLWVNTPWGRFFFKYWKFSTQVSRLVDRTVIKPLLTGSDDEAKEALAKGLSFIVTMALASIADERIREKLALYVSDAPTFGEIETGFDQDTRTGFARLAELTTQNLLAMGAFGLMGSGYEYGKRLTEQGPGAVPFMAPGFAMIASLVDAAYRFNNQGTLTGKDFNDIIERNISLYRTGKNIGLRSYAFAADVDEPTQVEDKGYLDVEHMAALKMAEFDRRRIQAAVRRYSKEQGLDESKFNLSLPSMDFTENTPYTKEINRALLVGDAKKARQIMVDRIRSSKTDQEARSYKNSIQASARRFVPANVFGDQGWLGMYRFLQWSQQNLSPEDYELLVRRNNLYLDAADAAGIIKKPTMLDLRKLAREEQKKQAQPNIRRVLER